MRESRTVSKEKMSMCVFMHMCFAMPVFLCSP